MDAPRLEFPCDYPIKVMIRAGEEVRLHVDAVMDRHGGAGTAERASLRPSAQGNFAGITYTIVARDEAHIAALFADLKSVPGVLMVL
jgi:putative lipoic acid-binding regulatory protein